MKINSIEIENFRNIEKLKLNFEDVNIIWGENAQGKTNLIEAIYLFTGSKSFRGVRDKELVKFGEKKAELKIDFENKKILEIGCGIGRWAEVFHDKCDSYLGIDYSEDLIEIAKENYNYDNCHFQVLSASQLDTADLLVSAPFDIVIITGVLIYFNDDTIKKMIKDLNSLCASNKTIYIRETLSFLETRLTLKDFFSENLEADYNAIYRTDDEFLDFIKGIDGNITIETGEIFDELKNFTETGYKYFLIKSVN